MLVIDLPYAHETVGTYPAVRFFPPGNPRASCGCHGKLHPGASRIYPDLRSRHSSAFRRELELSCSTFFSTRNGVALNSMNADSSVAGSINAS